MITSNEFHQIYCNVPQFYPWRINQLGGRYVNGKPLPPELRIQILQYAESGVRPCDISRHMKITHGCISKLLSKYKNTGSLTPGSAPFIEQTKKSSEGKKFYYKSTTHRSRKKPISPATIQSGLETISQMNSMQNTISLGDFENNDNRNDTCREVSDDEVKIMEEEKQPFNIQREGKEKPYTHSIKEILNLTRTTEATTSRITKAAEAIDSLDFPTDSNMSISESLSSQQATSTRRSSDDRIHFSRHQLCILQGEFMINQYPGRHERETIAGNLEVNANKIKIWFSNARAKSKENKKGVNDTELS